MKAKVIKSYPDKITNRWYNKGEIVDFEEKRIEELINKKIVEKISEKKDKVEVLEEMQVMVVNLDKYIRIALTNLSKKYKITIVEITVAKEERVNKTIRATYVLIANENDYPLSKEFKNKRELVRWLMCLQ